MSDINAEKLKSPPVEYRPANYWGWLADITPEESAWQVEEMYKAGLGGYVAHSRGGRLVPYMGEEWLDSVRSIIDTGKKYGMMTIVDDEDGWPSGFGGGKVNGMGEDYHVKWLVCEEVEEFDGESANLLEFYEFGGKKIKISYKADKYYVDNMNPETVDAFIQAGYESYYSKFGDEFYGIFSDEPQLARHGIPWSNILPEEFMKRYGYDIKENLHAIFYDTIGCEKIRFDFWKLVSEFFEISYAKKIGDWCMDHNIIFTGHTTCEESFAWQMQCSGSTMQFYEWFDIPGMDWLCRIGVDDMAVKQLSSVCEQLGKKRVLSEMYGCAGWNIGFDDMKWIGEWHYVLGVNYMLQHLGLYSLLGSRKREYPASLFYQQPWWKDFNLFNDYFARLSMILSESSPVIDILVLHPMSGAWVIYNGSTSGKIYEFETSFKKLSADLLGANYDFHYGDDAIIKRHGKIDGKNFIIGNYSYKTVIIPSMPNIDSNTLCMLIKFAENGGKILTAGELPYLVNGEKNIEDLQVLERYTLKFDELEKYNSRPVYINYKDNPQNKPIYIRSQKYEENMCYYIVNTDNANAYLTDICVENNKNLKRLNLETCELENFCNINYNLRPTESLLLFETDEISPLVGAAICRPQTSTIDLNGEWQIKNMTENALVLDMCRYSFDGVNYSEDEIYIMALQKKLLSGQTNRDVTMEFKFEVDELSGECFLLIEEPEKNKININGEAVEIKNPDSLDWHYDKSFKKIPVKKYIKKGVNKITLTRYFYLSENVYTIKNDPTVHEAESNRVTFETELEAIYLLGDFSVEDPDGKYRDGNLNSMFADCDYKIKKLKDSVNINDLTKDGLPFFAGTVYLEREFYFNGGASQAVLSLNSPDATVVKIFVNGRYIKNLCWEPFEVDISKYLNENQVNIIGIELTNSLRNLLGPHHNKDGEIIAVSPYSYGTDEYSWNKEMNIVRFGAGDNIKTAINNKYSETR